MRLLVPRREPQSHGGRAPGPPDQRDTRWQPCRGIALRRSPAASCASAIPTSRRHGHRHAAVPSDEPQRRPRRKSSPPRWPTLLCPSPALPAGPLRRPGVPPGPVFSSYAPPLLVHTPARTASVQSPCRTLVPPLVPPRQPPAPRPAIRLAPRGAGGGMFEPPPRPRRAQGHRPGMARPAAAGLPGTGHGRRYVGDRCGSSGRGGDGSHAVALRYDGRPQRPAHRRSHPSAIRATATPLSRQVSRSVVPGVAARLSATPAAATSSRTSSLIPSHGVAGHSGARSFLQRRAHLCRADLGADD